MYLYPLFERIWHWANAALVLVLLVTGYELHGSLHLLGFTTALSVHQGIAVALVVLTLFAWFWFLTTGEWKQYVPAPLARLRLMLRYYLFDIFLNRPHPCRRTRHRKLNALQRLAYLVLHLGITPALWGTGLALLAYGAWNHWDRIWPVLTVVAQTHVAAAYGLLAFLILHVYLALTTSEVPFAYLRAMVTGWEPLPGDDGSARGDEDGSLERKDPSTS